MKVIKAAFSKTFPITQYYEKVYLEAELNEGDDTRKCLYELKKQVQDFFYESTAAAEKQRGTIVTDVPEEKPTLTKVADLIKEINFCKDAAVLEKTYKYIASTDEDLQAAYDKKLKQLQ